MVVVAGFGTKGGEGDVVISHGGDVVKGGGLGYYLWDVEAYLS